MSQKIGSYIKQREDSMGPAGKISLAIYTSKPFLRTEQEVMRSEQGLQGAL